MLWRAIYIYIYICVCMNEGSALCCRVPGCFPKHSGIPLPGEGSPKAVRGWQQSHSVYLREFAPHNKIFIHESCFKYRPPSKNVQQTQRHVVFLFFPNVHKQHELLFFFVCKSWRYPKSTQKLSQRVPKMTPKGVLGDLLGGPKNGQKAVLAENRKITNNDNIEIVKKTIMSPPSSSHE